MTSVKPTIIQWKCFVQAVTQGSMLKASESLQMEVSEVSQQIKALEEFLQEQLLERSRRGVRPTWAGQKRFSAAKELIRIVEEAFRPKAKESEVARLAIPVSLSGLFMGWIGKYEREVGLGTAIEVNEYIDNSPSDLWSYNMVICVNELPNERVLARPLGLMKRIMCASHDFVERFGKPSSPEDLAAFPLLMMRSQIELLSSGVQKIRLDTNPQILVNSADALVDAALLSQGVAVGAPYWAVRERIDKGDLVIILP